MLWNTADDGGFETDVYNNTCGPDPSSPGSFWAQCDLQERLHLRQQLLTKSLHHPDWTTTGNQQVKVSLALTIG